MRLILVLAINGKAVMLVESMHSRMSPLERVEEAKSEDGVLLSMLRFQSLSFFSVELKFFQFDLNINKKAHILGNRVVGLLA